uniref:Uncharacterized protein n=1 Tax=Syphacia muris TaxID=451379 RepID=A0A0N5AB54_9BILA
MSDVKISEELYVFKSCHSDAAPDTEADDSDDGEVVESTCPHAAVQRPKKTTITKSSYKSTSRQPYH